MTDPKHAWPPPRARHGHRGGAHRAVVVRHPRRIVSVATGLAGVLVVALTATMSPQAAVDAAVPPSVQAAAPSAPAPVFQLPAGSGPVVVWPVRQVADTDPIADTSEATTSVDVPAATVSATTEGTADPVETPAPTTTQTPPTRTHRSRPTPTPAPTPVSCSPGGAA